MGQYHKVVNLDKHEYVHPHELGCGLKLWEQISNHPNTGTALLVLCACSNDRGGGDFAPDEQNEPVIGRWAGDRIAVVGDYAKDGDLAAEHVASSIYERCEDEDGSGGQPLYRNITPMVARVIERELNGQFVGDGWKGWKENDADSPKQPAIKPDIILTRPA